MSNHPSFEIACNMQITAYAHTTTCTSQHARQENKKGFCLHRIYLHRIGADNRKMSRTRPVHGSIDNARGAGSVRLIHCGQKEHFSNAVCNPKRCRETTQVDRFVRPINCHNMTCMVEQRIAWKKKTNINRVSS